MLEQGLSSVPCTPVKNVIIVFSPPVPPRIFSPHFANPWVAEKGWQKRVAEKSELGRKLVPRLRAAKGQKVASN
jgi:hypothetical protein